MRRVLFVAAAVLTLAGCSSTGTSPAKPSAAPAITAARSAAPAPTTAATTIAAVACALRTSRDVLVRMVAPGANTVAQTVGDVDVAKCRSVFDLLKATSPTDAGDCTTAAYASDNPGYNPDAVPAPPLKKVQLSIGPTC